MSNKKNWKIYDYLDDTDAREDKIDNFDTLKSKINEFMTEVMAKPESTALRNNKFFIDNIYQEGKDEAEMVPVFDGLMYLIHLSVTNSQTLIEDTIAQLKKVLQNFSPVTQRKARTDESIDYSQVFFTQKDEYLHDEMKKIISKFLECKKLQGSIPNNTLLYIQNIPKFHFAGYRPVCIPYYLEEQKLIFIYTGIGDSQLEGQYMYQFAHELMHYSCHFIYPFKKPTEINEFDETISKKCATPPSYCEETICSAASLIIIKNLMKGKKMIVGKKEMDVFDYWDKHVRNLHDKPEYQKGSQLAKKVEYSLDELFIQVEYLLDYYFIFDKKK